MKKVLSAALAGAFALAAFSGSALAVGKNDPTSSCGIGFRASDDAHLTQSMFGQGLGEFFKSIGIIPGHQIQVFHDNTEEISGCP